MTSPSVNMIELIGSLLDAGVAVGIMGFWVWTLRQQNIEAKEDHIKAVDDLKKENAELRAENLGLHDASKEELKELLPLVTDTTRILNEVTKEGQVKILDALANIERKISA